MSDNTPETGNVLHLNTRNAAVTSLQDALRDLVYSFVPRISVAEAVGTLEIVKRDLIEQAQQDSNV